jgi:ATP-dependent helicase STH1/SNF2
VVVNELPDKVETIIEDVESKLADEVETIIKCQRSNLQVRLYDQIRKRRLGGGEIQKRKA